MSTTPAPAKLGVLLALALLVPMPGVLADTAGLEQEKEKKDGSPPAEEPAPESRAELWRRGRLAGFDHITPYKPAFIERQILAFEKAERPSIFGFNLLGIYPRSQTISRGSKTGYGFRFWQPDVGGSAFDVHASSFFSLPGYELYELQFGRVPHRGRQIPLRSTQGDDLYELGDLAAAKYSPFTLYAALRYRHLPQEDFYGLGPDARKDDHSSFLLQDASYDLVAGYQFGRHVSATLRGGFAQFFVAPGEDERLPTTQSLFDDGSAPGLVRQPDFLRFAGKILVDFRDEPGNPHEGAMLAVSYTRYDDRDGSEYGFDRLTFDARGFVPLGSRQRVLALRALASFDDARRGGRIPFYLQETLGGSHTFRGFQSFRFRGEKLLLLQAEYRWEAAPAVELALFTDAGTVARQGESFDLERLRADYGVGLRFKTFDNLLMRFEVARSTEGTILLLRFSPVF